VRRHRGFESYPDYSRIGYGNVETNARAGLVSILGSIPSLSSKINVMDKFRELPVKEYDVILEMFNAASEYGLEAEVTAELVCIIKNDPTVDIAEAVAMALIEWNI